MIASDFKKIISVAKTNPVNLKNKSKIVSLRDGDINGYPKTYLSTIIVKLISGRL